jgi:ankyrin repeat protein
MAMKMRATILAALMGSTIFAGAALAADASNVSLVTAAKQGDRAAVQSVLSGRAKHAVAGAEGTAALVWAATRNDLAMADLLLRAGANVKAANEFGATPLYAAVAHADPAMTERLLAAGADPNAALMSGETPLMEAARRGNLADVRVLLANHANPNVKESNGGQTALMWALSERQSAVVEERGLQYDRRWMLIDEENKFMTQRVYPQMALFKVSLESGNFFIHYSLFKIKYF